MRLKVLAARDEAIQSMLSESRLSLSAISTGAQYKALLTGLIVQGVKKLEAKAAVVRCREMDVAAVKAAMAEAEAAVAGLKLTLDVHVNLPPAPEATKEGVSCVGGVHVISMDGKIICNNSLDDRLKVAFERNQPEIRTAIFGSNPNLLTSKVAA
jgi:V-type H+-transporting ATPase subunit E